MPKTIDTLIIQRKYQSHIVYVTAVYIPSADAWGMTCTVDNEVTDHYQAADPWHEAQTLMDKAFLDTDYTQAFIPQE